VPDGLSGDLRALLGAYFLHEYSVEAAALTNPSIVLAPDQTGTPSGSVRVIVSLRGVGEGHISSIQLRTGLIGPGGAVHIDEPRRPLLGRRYPPLFDKAVFLATLEELAVSGTSEAQADQVHRTFADHGRNPVELALAPLADRFTIQQLEEVLRRFELPGVAPDVAALAKSTIHWLANSNYELAFPARSHPSQRVLFPRGPSESHGMEDARFVRFTRDDGSALYLGTYTAYDGFHILPQLIETQDFSTFRIGTLSGSAARNKGIAIFPRRIGGRYVALARSDAENNYLMTSDHLRVWEETHRIQVPVRPWELIQIGNAGAPIETDAGWLVITHGVGPSVPTRSGRCCSTSTTRGRSSATCRTHCWSPTMTNATATSQRRLLVRADRARRHVGHRLRRLGYRGTVREPAARYAAAGADVPSASINRG
jgi:hypothetical protein